MTTKYAQKNIYDKTKNGLYFIGFLAYSFLIGQLIVWYQLMSTGYYATTNVANAFFYLFTTIARSSYSWRDIFLGKNNFKIY